MNEGQLNPIQLMRKINELEDKINALKTIQTGGIWTAWTPSYSASGSMTYTSVTTNFARYSLVGKICFIRLQATGTTGGTASTSIIFTAPFLNNASSGQNFFTTIVTDTTSTTGWSALLSSGSQNVSVLKYDSSNYGLGADRLIRVEGFYEIA